MNIINKNDILFLVIIMKVNLSSWMKNISDNTGLFELNIPGTHDSVTERVPLSHLAKCQDLSIFDQLSLGVRALDLRVKSNGDNLTMVHGAVTACNPPGHFRHHMDMADVLDECYQFLDKNPSESIIIQFKNDNGTEMEKCFHNLFYNYIQKNSKMWFVDNRMPTLGEVRGKLVLIRRCACDKNNPDFSDNNTGIDFSAWVEQDEVVPDALVLCTNSAEDAKFLIQDRYKYKPEPRWEECILPFLDNRTSFSGEYVICYLSTAGGIKGPENNAKYINAKFSDYPLDSDKYYGILYLDFPTTQLTEKIIETNY